ncbi:MAG: PmeII family type II restriction endonuclease [Chloroflexi bacterium]|nr:PmeII family type II restriction endonuclease [Chloroflexota bacterium]
MKPIPISIVTDYVEKNIGTFHKSRLRSLQRLKLEKILKRKNPYLFKAKNILTSENLIRTLLDAHLSSQEETLFGNFLEHLAIFINEYVYSGKESPAEGIDLEFVKGGKRFIISIKSGPNWGNSSQIKKMVQNFKTAKKVLRAHNSNLEVIAANGCCYGIDQNPDKGDYYKYCGQEFWEFISGNKNLYLELIVPLGHKAKLRNDEFQEEYSKIVNIFTTEFSDKFCKNGKIDWEALVKFNSAKNRAE